MTILQIDGEAIDALCDFRFALIDAFDGESIGSVASLTGVPVDEGLFTVELDFGVNAFDGGGRLLDVEVRCPGGSGAYTTLSPRQKLTAAPYALYALQAPWSGLKNVPPGLDDGDDNTTYSAGTGLTLTDTQVSLSPTYRLPQSCTNGQSAVWSGSAWVCGAGGNGDITAVYAGAGLSGGATNGDAMLAAAFGGNGAANTVARSDHNHLGQTWNGSDNPLEIVGSFDIAPLVVSNDTGSGLYVGRADTDGVYLNSAGRNGITLGYADFDGVNVYSAGRDGVFVQTAGAPSTVSQSTKNNGFEVAGAQGNGVFVGRADWNGVEVNSAEFDGIKIHDVGEDGVSVDSAGWSGVYVNSAEYKGIHVNAVGDDGIYVGSAAGGDGMSVHNAGHPSTTNASANSNGFEVAGAEGHGLYVGQADVNGVEVNSAANDGVHVNSARYGLDVSTAELDGVYVGLVDDDGVDVYWASDDGVHVDIAGNPSNAYYSDLHNGFEVASAQGDGLYVGRADANGVEVSSAGTHGVFVSSVGVHSRANYPTSPTGFGVAGVEGAGLYVGRADQRGVEVISAGWDGVFVSAAGNPSTTVGSAAKNGFEVAGAEGFGLHVGYAGVNGVEVKSAGYDGIYVLDADRRAATFNGDILVTGDIKYSGGSTMIDHPLNPEQKYLNHAIVESSEMKNIYDGVVVLDANGEAWVDMSAWFEALNQDFRYQLTSIGGPGPGLYIAEEIHRNRFQIAGGDAGLKVSWQVTGIRHDPYAEANPITVEEVKPDGEQGTYLHPEVYDETEMKGMIYNDAENLAREAAAAEASDVGES